MFVTPSNYITIYVLFFLLGSFSTTSVAFLLPLQGMVALLGEGVVMLRQQGREGEVLHEADL